MGPHPSGVDTENDDDASGGSSTSRREFRALEAASGFDNVTGVQRESKTPIADPDTDPAARGGSFGIVLLVLLWLLYAILPLLYLMEVPYIEPAGLVRLMDARGAEPIANGVLAASALITAAGLLLGRSWGYLLAMLLVGIGLVFDIWAYVQGEPAFVHMALAVTITFYLNQSSVRRHFMKSAPPPTATGHA